MLGRAEEAVVIRLTINASNGKVITVSQTEIITMGGGPSGRKQFSTYPLELPVPHSIHTEIPHVELHIKYAETMRNLSDYVI